MKGNPRQHQIDAGGVELAYFEWGNPGSPVILLVHATGFHARCWDRTIASLVGDYRVIAPDMRGHGRSARQEPYVWTSFTRDLEHLVDSLQIRDAIGVGHSLGGHCITQLAAGRPGIFKRLLLVDPVILDPQTYSKERYSDLAGPEDHPVARRRNHWASWQEMFQRFRDRHPFSLWQPQALEDYCRFGLRPRADGEGFELACLPVVEASIYLGNARSDIYERMSKITIPIVVLRAKARDPDAHDLMDFASSPTWESLAAQFPRGRDVYLPHLSHFIPMQDPQLTARFIADEHALP